MDSKLKLFQISVPVTCYVYANDEERAKAEVLERIKRVATLLSDPTFEANHPGRGEVHIEYDESNMAVRRWYSKRLT